MSPSITCSIAPLSTTITKATAVITQATCHWRAILKHQGNLLVIFESDTKQISIGRNPKTDINIDNPAVSNSHAVVRKILNTYLLEDLGNSNGTFVNEKKIYKYGLIDGDEVIIGEHSLVFNFIAGNAQDLTDYDKTMTFDTRKQKELLAKNK